MYSTKYAFFVQYLALFSWAIALPLKQKLLSKGKLSIMLRLLVLIFRILKAGVQQHYVAVRPQPLE